MREKHYFASANTGNGFENCFDSILEPDDNKFLYILKGGPGTGKSTMIKTIGQHFLDLNFKIEYFYCSSDFESLDGVRIVEKNIAIVDGTSPHVTEADIPNVNSKIINIGEFIGNDIRDHKYRIIKEQEEKKEYFNLCYSNLIIAKELEKQSLLHTNTIINTEIYNNLIQIKFEPSKKYYARRLFDSCFSSLGRICFFEKNKYEQIIEFKSDYANINFNANKFLNFLCENKIANIQILDILSPEKINSIIIPDSNTLIQFLNTDQKSVIQDSFEKKAGEMIEKAKFHHKNIEQFYIPNMDFNGVINITNKLIKEIEQTS